MQNRMQNIRQKESPEQIEQRQMTDREKRALARQNPEVREKENAARRKKG